MHEDKRITYFLGTNSAEGFCSFAEDYLPPGGRRRVCILKGGPGTGKSFLMRAVAERAEAAGVVCERYACASDPHSLDGVVFPELGTAVLDGTAPHVIEAACPGAVEDYVSLSPCWDGEALTERRAEIERLTAEARALRRRATHYLAAAGELCASTLDIALRGTTQERLYRRGRALARRYIPAERRPGGSVQRRLIGAITPQGRVFMEQTVLAQCERVVTLTDRLGLAPLVLAPVLSAARGAGLRVIACYCPLNPKKLEHLLLPSLGVAFVTVTPDHTMRPQGARGIRTDHIPPREYLELHREELRDNERRAAGLVDSAVRSLAGAAALHGRLEEIYTPCMDLSSLDRLRDTVAERVLRCPVPMGK